MGDHVNAWRAGRRAEARARNADAVASLMTGLGQMGRDKARDSRPAEVAWLSPPEIMSMTVTEGIVHRLGWGVAGDVVGDGWEVHRDGGLSGDADDLCARLELPTRLTECYGSARSMGGAHLLLVPVGTHNPMEPRPERIDIATVHVIDAIEATPILWCNDTRVPAWSRPETWSIAPIRPGISIPIGWQQVHRSWLVTLPGLPVLRSMQRPVLQGYQLSAAQVYWEALRDLGLAHRSSALAAMVQSVLAMRVKGSGPSGFGAENTATMDYTTAVQIMQATLSSLGVAVSFGEDEITRLEAPMTGLDAIVRVQYDRISAPEGFPLTRLLGQPPAGMSTDDAAGQRTYNDFRRRSRRGILDPAIREVLRAGLGPGRYDIEWTPLDVPTAAEVAAAETARAGALAQLVMAGIWTPDEAREVYRGKLSPSLRLAERDEEVGAGGDLPADLMALFAPREP